MNSSRIGIKPALLTWARERATFYNAARELSQFFFGLL